MRASIAICVLVALAAITEGRRGQHGGQGGEGHHRPKPSHHRGMGHKLLFPCNDDSNCANPEGESVFTCHEGPKKHGRGGQMPSLCGPVRASCNESTPCADGTCNEKGHCVIDHNKSLFYSSCHVAKKADESDVVVRDCIEGFECATQAGLDFEWEGEEVTGFGCHPTHDDEEERAPRAGHHQRRGQRPGGEHAGRGEGERPEGGEHAGRAEGERPEGGRGNGGRGQGGERTGRQARSVRPARGEGERPEGGRAGRGDGERPEGGRGNGERGQRGEHAGRQERAARAGRGDGERPEGGRGGRGNGERGQRGERGEHAGRQERAARAGRGDGERPEGAGRGGRGGSGGRAGRGQHGAGQREE